VDRAEKAEVVSSLQQAFAGSGAVVVAHYAGLSVSDFEKLRVQMKQAGGQVKVAKNRLAKLALKDTETADISDLLTGPTVLAYSEDPITAPRIAKKFADTNSKFVILGGAMGLTGLDADGVCLRWTNCAQSSPVCLRSLRPSLHVWPRNRAHLSLALSPLIRKRALHKAARPSTVQTETK
jgi:large subunit ribosomal protein L10